MAKLHCCTLVLKVLKVVMIITAGLLTLVYNIIIRNYYYNM